MHHCKAHSRVLVRSDGQGLCAPCFESSQPEQAEEGLGGRGKKRQDIFVFLEHPSASKVSLSGQVGERQHVRLDDGMMDGRQMEKQT